ncbi:hypothetical protein M404DRAFT_44227, partial [Pisolithus tinctorius Marx 270]
NLGDWTQRQLRKGIAEQGSEVHQILGDCGIDILELWNKWASQCSAQLSIWAHVLAQLKKELDTVLVLQANLEVADQALQAAHAIIEKDATEDTLEALESLEHSHDHLLNKVDLLYASLNIHDMFPKLNGVNIKFVQMLLLAHDLKINI